MLIIGVGVFTAASLACGCANGEAMLLISRAFQGAGAAIAAPTAFALVATTFAPGPARNQAIAIVGSMGMLLIAIGVWQADLLLLLLGAAGLFQWAPQLAIYYLADAIGTEVTLLVVGVLLLGVAFAFTRLYRRVLHGAT